MLIESLARNASDAAVIFFAGWGMDARPFENICLKKLGCDLLLAHSYHQNVEEEFRTFEQAAARYRQVAVVGWSFGVAVAWSLMERFPKGVTTFTALNGTPCPIHTRYGIDPRVMRRTVERFGEVGREAFYVSMCGNERESFTAPERSTQDLNDELVYLQKRFEGKDVISGNVRDTLSVQAYVGESDRIIPMKNQIAAWESRNISCQCVQGSHYNPSLFMDVLQQAASHVRTLAL